MTCINNSLMILSAYTIIYGNKSDVKQYRFRFDRLILQLLLYNYTNAMLFITPKILLLVTPYAERS